MCILYTVQQTAGVGVTSPSTFSDGPMDGVLIVRILFHVCKEYIYMDCVAWEDLGEVRVCFVCVKLPKVRDNNIIGMREYDSRAAG